ncbi:hypothetical protein UZ36_03790 [Candidatus Nitromaritima sp. SCGC AAA799-C22]|nr:hypothetical protein UZ36_03790 [Candidatus Nitromaritima sp. SCGC AAA799-C22]
MVEQKNIVASKWIFILLCMFVAGGCAALETSDSEAPPPPEPVSLAHPFTDIPVPSDFDRDRSKSFIYESGSGTIKVGRLFFAGWKNLDETVSFYQSEMINQGWKLVNSLTHDGKILNYEKEGWVCTVIIQPTWLGSDIEIRIGPK